MPYHPTAPPTPCPRDVDAWSLAQPTGAYPATRDGILRGHLGLLLFAVSAQLAAHGRYLLGAQHNSQAATTHRLPHATRSRIRRSSTGRVIRPQR
jgi:hypothetical protein